MGSGDRYSFGVGEWVEEVWRVIFRYGSFSFCRFTLVLISFFFGRGLF